MEGKVVKAIIFGYKLICGATAAYFTNKALEKKAQELVDEGGMLNAAIVGAGQSAISIAAGVITYTVVG